MRAYAICPRFIPRPLVTVAMLLALVTTCPSVWADVVDPLVEGPVEPNLFTTVPAANPFTRPAPLPQQPSRFDAQQVHYQSKQSVIPAPPTPPPGSEVQDLPAPPRAAAGTAKTKDPCGALQAKPLGELEIGIAEPAGKLPTDLAAPCWAQINQTDSAARCWPIAVFSWDATCFYHNPLYFEEVNLERYGYQCGDKSCCATCCRESCCLQPAASAAHFYLSVFALPYCMAVDCPGDCVYTLGHYRPGNCNPWRRHWPPTDLLAATATAGFYVGMVALFP